MIDSTALIDASAQIDESVVIGAFCRIGANVHIGQNTVVHSHVVIEGTTTIGENNQLYPFAAIGVDCQDLNCDRSVAVELRIGDNNIIREHVTIHRGSSHHRGITEIGNNNFIMVGAHIAHDCILGNHLVMANNAAIAGHVVIGSYAIIGGYTTVHQFSTIGAYAMIGQSSAVSRDVPAFFLASGNRARAYGINTIGMLRRGFDADDTQDMLHVFKTVYNGPLGKKHVVERVRSIANGTKAHHIMLDSLGSFRRSIIQRIDPKNPKLQHQV